MEQEQNKFGKLIKELIPYILIFIIVVLIRTYLVTPVKVNGESMYPTLKGKEYMILNKLNKDFKRFDIVVIDTGKTDIIKRIIALPGESISCEKDNKIYINGRKLNDKYAFGNTCQNADIKKITLAKDEYYVMGDNREDSLDSRYYGPFAKKKIKGTTKIILFPFNKIGKIK